MSINVAVLGCGMMGQEHISYMEKYNDLHVKFLCDPNAGSIEAALALLSVKADEAKPQIFADEMEMFKRVSEVDLLLIATPNYLHTPQLLRWAQHPITILVEKPVAISVNQVQALRSATKSFRADIWVAMEYRYIPAIQKLIQLLPEIGPIKSITIRENRFPFLSKVEEWNKEVSKSGDTLVEKCCHFFDLFRLISKEEMKTCSTKVHRGLLSKHYGYDKRTDNPVPIIESAYVLLDFLPLSPEYDGTDANLTKEGEIKCNVDKHSTSSFHNGSLQYQNPTMGCLELCMFAEGSRHQEEVIVTGLKGRLEAYLPENKVFFYLRPNESEWLDRSKPPPRSSIKEQVIDCSDLKQVYSFADEVPKHSGYHYSSTAIEWKFLIDEIKKVRSGEGNFVPQVSLNDGIAAVEMGMTAQKNIYSANCRSTASFAPSIGMEPIVACNSSPSEQLLSLALGLTSEQKTFIAEAVMRESQANLLRYGGECAGIKDHFEAIRF